MEQFLEQKLSGMSLQEKVGQLFMCGFHGTEPSADIRQLIEKCQVGGIIYFRRNVNDVEQVCRLSSGLQHIAAASGSTGLPLLISIDQEGGMVARIDTDDVTLTPGNMTLGATRDSRAAYETALISGRELREMGINMNFAPCLDVNNNPNNPVIGIRSYGEDPVLVGELGAATVRGFQEAGVAATVKHFPGHGDTDSDSHLGLPTIPHAMERLEQIELAPFRHAIGQGVDAVMTAHVVFTAMDGDSQTPSTLSQPIVTGLLRGKLGYDGVVVSDCLEMNAISEGVGVAEGSIQAILAGIDLVLVSHRIDRQVAAIEAVVQAVESGRIPMSRIDESALRILRLKAKRIGTTGDAKSDCAGIQSRIGLAEDREIVRGWYEKSVTLVKDEGQQLPLQAGAETLVVWPEVRQGTEVDEIIAQEMTLGAALSAYIDSVREVRIGIAPTAAETADVLAQSAAFKQVVVATYNASFAPGQVELVRKLAERKDVKLVVAAVRNPFDLREFPEVGTYFATYENRPVAMQSLAKALTGRMTAEGALPVTIPLR